MITDDERAAFQAVLLFAEKSALVWQAEADSEYKDWSARGEWNPAVPAPTGGRDLIAQVEVCRAVITRL